MSAREVQAAVLVWDVPTRVFHWIVALSFAAAYATGDSERWRDVHVLAGYTVAGMIAFRLLWGVVGTRYARFRAFLFGPRAVLRYLGSLLRGRPEPHLGHNPAGSVAIFLVLALAALAVATGYAAYALDVGWIAEAHEAAVNGLLAMVGVHVAGVAVSSVLHRENLARAMVTGRKRGPTGEGIRRAHAWLGALLVAGVIGFWYQHWHATPPDAALAAAGVERRELH